MRVISACAGHRWAAGIAFIADGTLFRADHWAMPFGAVASVFAWDRIGALLAHLGRVLLHIPILRWGCMFGTACSNQV